MLSQHRGELNAPELGRMPGKLNRVAESDDSQVSHRRTHGGAAKWSTGTRLGRQRVPKWPGSTGEGIASSDLTLLPPAEERRGGRGCRDFISCTAILAPLGTGDIENCSEGLAGEETNTGRRASGGTTQKGKKGFSSRPSTTACPGTSRAWQGQRRAAHFPGQLHTAAGVKAVGAALEQRRGQQEGALGDERAEGLQPAAGWGDDSSGPPGQNVSNGLRPLLCDGEFWAKRRGLPGRLGSTGSCACRTRSYLPGPAIGGIPEPPEWTSSDRGTAL